MTYDLAVRDGTVVTATDSFAVDIGGRAGQVAPDEREGKMRHTREAMLRGLVGAALALMTAGPALAACEPDKVATKYPGLAGKILKVGLDPTLPPVMYRDPKDPSKIVGQDPDMVA